MVACDMENFGCDGGFLINAIDFLVSEGVVEEDCMPYKEKNTRCEFDCTENEVY
jgi:hypothetical protein